MSLRKATKSPSGKSEGNRSSKHPGPDRLGRHGRTVSEFFYIKHFIFSRECAIIYYRALYAHAYTREVKPSGGARLHERYTMSDKRSTNNSCRLNKVGGQAVLEGVMMKAGTKTVTTCRKEDGSLAVYEAEFTSVRKKHKILDLPIVRGVVNFIEMMALSVRTLNSSADALGIEEEDGKVEKWMKKHLGVSLTDAIMGFSVILALCLSLILFKFLPTLAATGLDMLTKHFWDISLGGWRAPVEGAVKIGIFLLYLWLTSLLPDIRRTFMYHGAEHKSIACFEAGEELTPENASKHKRFHPRCGTSFMFLMIAIGILISLAIRLALPDLKMWAYMGISLLTLPLSMGIGYEFLMIAGKHDNAITRFISAPGLWVQRITTKEPTLDMLEVAIVSIKGALRSEFPEYQEFWDRREWEKKDESVSADNEPTEAEKEDGERDVEAGETAESKVEAEAVEHESAICATSEEAPAEDGTRTEVAVDGEAAE